MIRLALSSSSTIDMYYRAIAIPGLFVYAFHFVVANPFLTPLLLTMAMLLRTQAGVISSSSSKHRLFKESLPSQSHQVQIDRTEEQAAVFITSDQHWAWMLTNEGV